MSVQDSYLSNIVNICKAKKLRFTKLRRKILEIIIRQQPIKAYDILRELQILEKNDQSASVARPPTVYRSLEFFLDHKFIHRLNSLNSYIVCTHPDTHTECFFVICIKCKQVNEHCSNNILKAVEEVSDSIGFKLRRAIVEIDGICKKCHKKKEKVSLRR